MLRIRLCEYLRIANYYGRPSCSKCTVRRWMTVISCTISARVCVQKLQQLDLEEPELEFESEFTYFLTNVDHVVLCKRVLITLPFVPNRVGNSFYNLLVFVPAL